MNSGKSVDAGTSIRSYAPASVSAGFQADSWKETSTYLLSTINQPLQYLRSLQYSPVYPEAHSHLPSAHVPPFIHTARHESLPPTKYFTTIFRALAIKRHLSTFNPTKFYLVSSNNVGCTKAIFARLHTNTNWVERIFLYRKVSSKLLQQIN